ncbi:uncharacterized protein LOC110179820 [Drosophila serrata]|uniref:uncharacterized protein LOC110179820 n=1 Tax=Drosophila serrata TaxID=7274 RepID=UPI000A1D1D8D|nr:uncharacterized protein LOC110179820 [Drosophila serrata]
MYKPFGYLNFYRVLGVNEDASEEEIKKAFHQLASRCHPDKSRSGATEKEFKKILHAYKVLTDVVQRNYHNIHLRQRQQRNSNRTHPRHEEAHPTQEPSISQRFWSWLLPHRIFVAFVWLRLWLTSHCQMRLIFARSGLGKCFQRAKLLLIELWPQVRECAITIRKTAVALVKWSLCAHIKMSLWSIKHLVSEMLRAFVGAPGSPIQKLICVSFAWQIAVLGHRVGVWPWVGCLMLYIIRFSLIFIMFCVKCIIYLLLNTIK